VHYLSRYSIVVVALSSSHLCVLLLRLCSCVHFYSHPYSEFDCDHLCKACETPIYGDSSQRYIDIRKTIMHSSFIFGSLERG
jgi:hypothetical protein